MILVHCVPLLYPNFLWPGTCSCGTGIWALATAPTPLASHTRFRQRWSRTCLGGNKFFEVTHGVVFVALDSYLRVDDPDITTVIIVSYICI